MKDTLEIKMNKSLILSSNKLLWPEHGHAILVDDFCNREENSKSNLVLDFEIAKHYGLNKNINDQIHKEIIKIYDLLLPQFVEVLNAYHQVRESTIYWERIITHWLFRSISALLTNYRHLEQIVNDHEIKKVLVTKEKLGDVIASDSLDFVFTLRNSAFVAVLRSEILRHIAVDKQDINLTEIQSRIINTRDLSKSSSSRKRVFEIYNNLLRKFDFTRVFKNYIFIGNTYLPKFQESILKMSFFQMPIFYESPLIYPGNDVAPLRNSSFQPSQDSCKVEQFIFSNIALLLPRSYLEDFHQYRSHIISSNLPKNPSLIVTANNYDTDDYFKIWSGEKAKTGSKIIVWQHGNNIGTARHSHYPEICNSDKYVTWGWNHNINSHLGFCQKIGPTPKPLSKHRNSLLLIQDQFPSNWNLTDTANRLKNYIQDQHTFIRSLSTQPMSSLIIRKFGLDLDNNSANKHWHDLEIQEDVMLNFDNKQGSIVNLIRKSRIAVFSYYSTGFLECLAMDHPAIAFWREGYDIFTDEAMKDFVPLQSSGLIHFSANSASEHINTHWDDVHAWWVSPRVVEAKNIFVEKHARRTRTPIRDFRSILKSF